MDTKVNIVKNKSINRKKSDTDVDTDDDNDNDDNDDNYDDDDNDLIDDNNVNADTDEPINLLTFFTRKELYYYKMIDKFFKKCEKTRILKILDIINGISDISLRVLDWFITKYSKKNIDFEENNGGEIFDVHISYKAQLKSYRKKYFDPFRRRKKFNYYYDSLDHTLKFNTTLGQLNFFQWAITHNIVAYVEKNIDKILKEMNSSNKEDKKKKEQKKKQKNKKKENKKEVVAKDIQIDDNIIIRFD